MSIKFYFIRLKKWLLWKFQFINFRSIVYNLNDEIIENKHECCICNTFISFPANSDTENGYFCCECLDHRDTIILLRRRCLECNELITAQNLQIHIFRCDYKLRINM